MGRIKIRSREKSRYYLKRKIEDFERNQRNENEELENQKRFSQRTQKPTTHNDSDENESGNCLGKIIGIGLVVAAVIWFVFSIAIPLIMINIAVIALFVGFLKKEANKILFPLSIIGSVLIIFDYNIGWSTKTLVNNASFFEGAIPFFYYLNVFAGLVAAYFLIRNWLNKKKPSSENEGEFSKRNMVIIGSLFLIGSLTIGIQKYFDSKNIYIVQSKIFTQPSTPVTNRQSENRRETIEEDHSQLISAPIDNLFKAWTELDLNLDMGQWDANGVQYSKKFEPRRYQDILTGRQSLFSRLKSVEVLNYGISNIRRETNDRVTLNVQYSMNFNFKNGKIVNELNIKEKYILKYTASEYRWVILENYDYID
ncbi:MAG: sulfite exporter TauE/SafE family protein [Saprospiraceae bacterium]|uniref:Sulfite exporter TauE/SafE family protein n=1 Tax=Candidatus Opimibacter skivensis TaxID=2982028 RepID=A0A9D7XQ74_9BACT|nr:sulfite exporter TauE/SafE family protein [Candidatus Opimibacter skivensis]